MALLNCIVVTPEKTAVESKAEFVVLPLYDGEIGIAPGRAPVIGRLGFGEMRLTAEGRTTRYYLDGGFVQVAGDVVNVLTNRATPAAEVDGQVAQKQLQAALSLPTATPELEQIRDRQIAQARAQLRVAARAAR
jgi:F-type H+-transporting ATPase subunit epsilon